jgi:hypothetical protein
MRRRNVDGMGWAESPRKPVREGPQPSHPVVSGGAWRRKQALVPEGGVDPLQFEVLSLEDCTEAL